MEAQTGVPFVGQAGATLNRILARNHQDRQTFRVDNVCRCQPPKNWFDERAPWYFSARQQCTSRHLSSTLAEKHKVIVALGGTALKYLTGLDKGIRVEDWHGTVVQTAHGLVVPTFHPSYLARGAMNLFGVASFDLQVALRVAAEGFQPEDPDVVIDPPVDWFTWWVEQVEAVVAQDPLALWLAVDIETPDKAGGQDEGLLTSEDQSYQILRVNFSVHPDEGVTVPYAGPYIALIERLLALACPKQLWNKEYDHPRLVSAGHATGGDWWDFMWAWHHLQSDVPRGLGFVAPFYSKFGAWKHLAGSHPGYYAACDGFQTYRVGTGIATDLTQQGMWENFARHTHALHQYALKPAQVEGVRISRERLTVFIADLEVKQRRLLHAMQGMVPEEVRPLTPKGGLKRCPEEGAVHTKGRDTKKDGTAKLEVPDPIKQELYAQVATVVSRTVRTVAYRCHQCGADDVVRTHRCPATKGPNPARLELVEADRTRWFWQEPFNPDSPQQILAYLAHKGHKPGKGKTGADSTDRETLERLKKETKDPLYAALIDSRAVIKVKGTYGVGTLKRLDPQDRVHPVPTFAPTTMRLSYRDPNITNVVADKEGEETLAAGFRRCVVAGEDRPAWLTAEQLQAWEAEWTQ